MSRLALALVLVASVAHADDAPAAATDVIKPRVDELGEYGIRAEIGLASGGRVTPGGLRIAGRYLQRLDEGWWFEGIAAFTFGSGAAACFRDRSDVFVCDHRFADGDAVELAASIRRMFAAQGAFHPYAHAGLGIGIAHFGKDGVDGFIVPAHLGGGVRAQVADTVAVVGEADVEAGIGAFSHGLGGQPLFGITILGGAEFKLR